MTETLIVVIRTFSLVILNETSQGFSVPGYMDFAITLHFDDLFVSSVMLICFLGFGGSNQTLVSFSEFDFKHCVLSSVFLPTISYYLSLKTSLSWVCV